MTETEAKTKWCAMVKQSEHMASDGEIIATFYSNGTHDGKCIGSNCMMWRELSISFPSDEELEAAPDVASGYCGLAGKP